MYIAEVSPVLSSQLWFTPRLHLLLFQGPPGSLRVPQGSPGFCPYGYAVQLRAPHGPAGRPDLWRSGPDRDLDPVPQGGPALQGTSPGQEERGSPLVPGTQGLLRHDPEAAIHGAVQVPFRTLEPS